MPVGGDDMDCPYCGCTELEIISGFAYRCIGCGEVVYDDELLENYFDDVDDDDVE